MEKETNLDEIELLDVCMEVNANLTVGFGGMMFDLPLETLKKMREMEMPTTIFGCIAHGLAQTGKSLEEVETFLEEAVGNGAIPSVVRFNPVDGGSLDPGTPETAPLYNLLIEKSKKISQEALEKQ